MLCYVEVSKQCVEISIPWRSRFPNSNIICAMENKNLTKSKMYSGFSSFVVVSFFSLHIIYAFMKYELCRHFEHGAHKTIQLTSYFLFKVTHKHTHRSMWYVLPATFFTLTDWCSFFRWQIIAYFNLFDTLLPASRLTDGWHVYEWLWLWAWRCCN